MSEFTTDAGTKVWAYCLMPNHVHLVMVPGEEDGLRAALGEAHRRYIPSGMEGTPLAGAVSLLCHGRAMLDRVSDWGAYLSSGNDEDTQAIRQHTRTARPLGGDGFVQHLESVTGKVLTPGRPGPKAKA